MDKKVLQVNMLGELSLTYGDKTIEYKNARSVKVWLFLAYMLYNKEKSIGSEKLANILWEDNLAVSDTHNSLKSLVYRVRSLLDNLYDGLGRDLIVMSGGSFSINPEVLIECDFIRFENLAKSCILPGKSVSTSDILAAYEEIMSLYKGDFLPMFSSKHWVAAVSVYLHNLLLDASECVSVRLSESTDYINAANVCRYALTFEPYNEDLSLLMLKSLYNSGNNEAVISAYDKIRSLLSSNFGIVPSEEATEIYRKASSEAKDGAVISEDILEYLREPKCDRGAMICGFDIFKKLYQACARQVVRNGEIYHVALFTIKGNTSSTSKKSIDKAVKDFRDHLFRNLRTGDVISLCTPSQFVVLLPQANYENSCMVCRRVISAYRKSFPHSPATVVFTVQPLEPNLF